MREACHRAKNLLTVVQVMARHTTDEIDAKAFAERLCQRLAGLAATHDLLVAANWRGVDIRNLARAQLAQFGGLVGTRITLVGPPLRLRPAAAQSIGMALRELTTNAAQYGALSSAAGSLRVEWDVVGTDRETRVSMRWSEEREPAPEAPQRRGFGHTATVDMVRRALDADVTLIHRPSGTVWELVSPAAWALETGRA
jgi:two-component sensor histidine kinase